MKDLTEAWIEEVSDRMKRRDGFRKDLGDQMDKSWRPHKYGKEGKVEEECPQVSGFDDGMESVLCNRPTGPSNLAQRAVWRG